MTAIAPHDHVAGEAELLWSSALPETSPREKHREERNDESAFSAVTTTQISSLDNGNFRASPFELKIGIALTQELLHSQLLWRRGPSTQVLVQRQH